MPPSPSSPTPPSMTSSTNPPTWSVKVSAFDGCLVVFLGICVYSLIIQLLQNQGHLQRVAYAPHNPGSGALGGFMRLILGILPTWWGGSAQTMLGLVCGVSALLLAVVFPYADCINQGKVKKMEHGWADVARCLTIFLGIIWATSKLPLLEGGQLSIILSAIAVGQWWLFDRTAHGFALSLVVAFFGSISALIVVYSGSYRFSKPDFFEIESWTPVLLFAGAICFGTIGRQMDLCRPTSPSSSPATNDNGQKLKTH